MRKSQDAYQEANLECALLAIRALINGVYDDPDLMSFGELHSGTDIEILSIIEKVLP